MIALRRRAAILILPMLALAGCNAPPPAAPAERVEVHEIDPAKMDSEPKPLPDFKAELKDTPVRLTLSASPSISLKDLSFRLRAENAGREPFDWDRQFVGGLEWRVAVSDGTSFVAPEVLELDGGKTVKRDLAHQKLLPIAGAYPFLPERFDRLEPGQTATGEIRLQSLGSLVNKVEMEKVDKEREKKVVKKYFGEFELPPGAKLVRVQVFYAPSHTTLASLQQREKVKLPPAAESNALEVSWK